MAWGYGNLQHNRPRELFVVPNVCCRHKADLVMITEWCPFLGAKRTFTTGTNLRADDGTDRFADGVGSRIAE